MLLQTQVIVSEVTNLHDARYCAGMGVQKIAFPVDKSLEKSIEFPAWKEITEWLSGPEFGVETNTADAVKEHDFNADFCLTDNEGLVAEQEGKFIFKLKTPEQAQTVIPLLHTKVDAFLLEFEGVTLEDQWQNMKSWAANYSIYIGFGITPENVEKVIEEIQPTGIGLKGGTEIKVGLNDFDGLADVLEAIEVW